MTKPNVLLTDPVSPSVRVVLDRIAHVTQSRVADADTFGRDVSRAHALIVRSFLPVDIFDHAPEMLVAVRHGAGADLIPVENANVNGVVVVNVPGMNGNAVAEFAVAQMITLSRRLATLGDVLRSEGWAAARALTGGTHELAGKTIGIVGVGSVGSRLAEICHFGFGMRVLGHRRRLGNLPPYVEGCSLEMLFSESDYVVLACPLTEETQGLVGGKLLSKMKKSACLVNVARGPVVDEAALITALRKSQIAGAVLDVFATEPLPTDSPFLELDNVLVTPHVSGISLESAEKLGMGALEEILRVLGGVKPRNFVNPECWPKAEARRKQLGIDFDIDKSVV